MPQAANTTRFPTIAEPAPTLEALYTSVLQIKQVVETLAGQRNGLSRLAAVTFKDFDDGLAPKATDKQFGVSRRNDVIQGGKITIPDDAVAAIVPKFTGGLILVMGGNNEGAYPQGGAGLIWFDTGASLGAVVIAGDAYLAAATGAMTGTTGTDTFLTVSANTGQLEIENRRGSQLSFNYAILLGDAS